MVEECRCSAKWQRVPIGTGERSRCNTAAAATAADPVLLLQAWIAAAQPEP